MSILSFSHYIEPWILPPGFNLLLIFFGWVVGCFCLRTGKLFVILGILSLWSLSLPFVAYNLINELQDQYSLLSEQIINTPQPHTAIVVLGGGDTIAAEYGYKQAPSDVTMQRLNYAVYLHKKMHLPIIVSGGKENGAIKSEAALMADYLKQQFNITADFIEDKSRNTAEESKYILPILKKGQFKKIILVTNAWHMPRSMSIFKRAGINIIPAPMGYYVYGPDYSVLSFLPNMAALNASSIAFHEYIGLVWYRIYYR